MKLILVALVLYSTSVYAIDKSHCGPYGFSPPAPDWVCNAPEGGTVPEPGSLALVAVGLVALRLIRRKK